MQSSKRKWRKVVMLRSRKATKKIQKERKERRTKKRMRIASSRFIFSPNTKLVKTSSSSDAR